MEAALKLQIYYLSFLRNNIYPKDQEHSSDSAHYNIFFRMHNVHHITPVAATIGCMIKTQHWQI